MKKCQKNAATHKRAAAGSSGYCGDLPKLEHSFRLSVLFVLVLVNTVALRVPLLAQHVSVYQ